MDSETQVDTLVPLLSPDSGGEEDHYHPYGTQWPTFPSSEAPKLGDKNGSRPSKRQLGFYDGLAMVLCTQIGSGIFISPSLVLKNSGSKPVALVTWLLAGLLTWACSLCYVELGVRMPRNGGPQEYLAHCFNDLAGFLASWGTIFALKPCTAALLAVFVSDYFCDAIGLSEPLPIFYRKLISLASLAILTFINCAGNTQSRISTKLLVVSKICGLVFVLVLSLSPLVVPGNSAPAPGDNTNISAPFLSDYPDAILPAIYAFSGWETLAFIGGELKNPQRIIAPVTNISMFIVILLFILTNVAYFSALSFDEITQAATVAITYSEHFLGRAGGIILAIFICLSGLGSLNVKTYTAGRITQAAAERGHLPPVIQTVECKKFDLPYEDTENDIEHPLGKWAYLHRPTRYKDGSTPLSAILFNATLASIYVLSGNLADLVIFTEYSIVFLTICGLVSLRQKPQNSEIGPPLFQVSYIVILFALSATFFILCASIIKHPFAGLGYIAFGMVTTLTHRYIIRK